MKVEVNGSYYNIPSGNGYIYNPDGSIEPDVPHGEYVWEPEGLVYYE